ncbi:head morphogenesis protein [Oricola thermophila]|uniref:Head morphogenesis protein n=1 Tax=Oricola thermophila TaxID=2742145 RepID=A0A6N1VF48_9HYPH|nr:head morphogenesis protein [Oricola thermophila]QKV17852.1 head morphogenesis protein [Oricola thermophila]
MARKTDAQVLEELLSKHDPAVRQAFLEAVSEISNSIILSTVTSRLEHGDISGAIEVLSLDEDAFSRVEVALLEAYNDGGQSTVDNLPRVTQPDGVPIRFSWGVRNTVAERALRDHAANMVREITADQKDGLREVLTEGLAHGDNPWSTARRIAGYRMNGSNERTGGLIGLTSRQMETVSWIRRALIEGDTVKLRRYLELKNRDARFDRTIAKIIRDGGKLPADKADGIASRYASIALDKRAKTLARHETFLALSKSRHDAIQQQIDAGKLVASDVTMTWKHTPRENPRLQHIAMNGQKVRFGEAFTAPDGTTLRYPHDPDAPIRHTINCMCRAEYKIDHTAAAIRRYRARVGG